VDVEGSGVLVDVGVGGTGVAVRVGVAVGGVPPNRSRMSWGAWLPDSREDRLRTLVSDVMTPRL
jgi:hypothetical protein